MSEEKMPATEAPERNSYELAFHVLPTVAEGEVSGVFESIKALITTNNGELLDEEAPERFELAYEVVKHIDTKNRKFTSAYFGWVRFSSEAAAIEAINEAMGENTNLLRHMLIKLTKAEEADVFRFHEALEEQKVVTVDAEPLAKKPKREKTESTKLSDSEESEIKMDKETQEKAEESIQLSESEDLETKEGEDKA